MKTGQAIGTTDRLGGEPETRPVSFEEIHATLYHNLGINLAAAPRCSTSGAGRNISLIRR